MNYQICVSGSTTGITASKSQEVAYAIGKAISSGGHTLLIGATIGLPFFAAKGALSVSESRGLCVGFSPASSFREHVAVYRLPVKEFDYINFTGMESIGRDIHLVRSADAIITIGGRMGSLHELATALEAKKVCAVLIGSGGLADFMKQLLEHVPAPGANHVIFESDPEVLVKKVITAIDARYADMPLL